jgi:hypothetical protein
MAYKKKCLLLLKIIRFGCMEQCTKDLASNYNRRKLENVQPADATTIFCGRKNENILNTFGFDNSCSRCIRWLYILKFSSVVV